MRACLQRSLLAVAIGVLLMPPASADQESVNNLLSQLIDAGGVLPRNRNMIDELLAEPASLKAAINSRLPTTKDTATLYYLGVIADATKDKDFAYTVWRAGANEAVDTSVEPWAQGKILTSFVEIARKKDTLLLEEIAALEVPLAPKLPEFAQRRIEHLARSGNISNPSANPNLIGKASPSAQTPPTPAANDKPTPPPPTEKPTPPAETTEVEKPNTLLFVLLGLLVVAIVVVVLRKARKQ